MDCHGNDIEKNEKYKREKRKKKNLFTKNSASAVISRTFKSWNHFSAL